MERLAAYGEPVEGTPFGRYRTPPPQPWWRRQRRELKWAIIAAILVILATSCGQHPNPAPPQPVSGV